MYLNRIPNIVKPLAKDLIFEGNPSENALYLSFDDGPHPEITPWVIEQLNAHNALGTFFLTGKNAQNHLDLFQTLKDSQHTIGNHGYNHLSGWSTSNALYFNDVKQAQNLLEARLFRPPYGQITLGQAQKLKQDFEIIMWSHLSGDFDATLGYQQCFHHATNKLKPGSIIVFHDSEKAWPRLKKCLPLALAHYSKLNFKLKAL